MNYLITGMRRVQRDRFRLGRIGLTCILLAGFLVSGCAAPQKKDVTPIDTITETVTSGIRHYNILGGTGLRVSDIGLGGGGTTDPTVVQYALDMGINYFDTAENYAGGRSESAIGQVAAQHREKMIICTKLYMDGNTSKEDVFTRFDGCLERLQTDYCDILMIHTGNREAVENPEIWAAFEELKTAGKIHFTGVSHHGPNLGEELRPLIEENKVDVILCSFDPVGNPGLGEALAEAHARGIGLVAMKVLSSARKTTLEEFESGEYPFHQAALRWALKNSPMHTLIPSINFLEQVDEYSAVSGAGRE